MAKRFIDTNIWKKSFIRSLKAPYKLLWMYIVTDCDHAGIWECDFECAKMKIGEKVTKEEALRVFAGKIAEIDGGEKWFIPSFIDFQYGVLSPTNRAHNNVIPILEKYDLIDDKLLVKPLPSPLQGGKEKEKEQEIKSIKSKSISVEEYIEEHKEDLSIVFSEEPELKPMSVKWLKYKWGRKEQYKGVGWATLMVDRARETSVEFVCAKINEAIAKESTQDYIYDNMVTEYKKLNGGAKNGQKQSVSKMDKTNDIFKELLEQSANGTGIEIGHQEGFRIGTGQ
jgi:hypothetical protein